jgi:metal-responsive CopG/Arc/MetJ family transcriptional regulator
MPRNVVKVAVTIPADLFRAVEAARRDRAQTRGAALREALQQWLRAQKRTTVLRRYEAGYRRRPESRREIHAALASAVRLLHHEQER